MTAVEQLEELMRQGWNIHIECKGKDREYEMTYEAHGRKVLPEDATNEDILGHYANQIHAVGDTFEEVIANLREWTLPQTNEQLLLEV